jgi:cytochrome c oxidase assembly protein subunit 15
VNVESTALARARGFELSAARFSRLSLAAVAALWLIVATGAAVRLTASGLGCEHWPGCTRGNPFPEKDYHAFIEFGNRMLGTVPILLTLAAAVAAWFVRGLPRSAAWLAVAVFVGTLAQAPLGFLTIYFDLNPLLVISHLLLALLVLGGAVVVALEALGLERGRAAPLVPLEVRRLGLVFAAAALALVVSGTFVTAAGPHSGGSDIRRLGTLTTALYVHVRVTALFGCVFLFLLGYLAARRERSPRLFRVSLALLALTLVQMGIGELQYRTHLPWPLVLVHVALAGAVWAGTVALATLFWRPLASLAPHRTRGSM